MSNTKTPKTPANNEIAAIEAVALEDVTGGCGACGQPHAAGTAPVGAAPRVAAFRNPFAFARR